MIAHCIGTPISWLRLEQYLLGELPKATQHEVEQHLDACAACRSCVDLARRTPAAAENAARSGAREERAVPPVTQRASRPSTPPRSALGWPGRLPPRRSTAIALSAAALAAATLLVLRPALERATTSVPARRSAIKGGELAIELIRDREGMESHDPPSVSRHDRLRIVLTCPPDAAKRWEALVYQADAVDFPLEGGLVACGNRVVLPGAFRMTATGPATICLVLDPPPRSVLRPRKPAGLPAPRVCQRIEVLP